MNIWFLSAYDQPKGISSRTYDFSKELVSRGHQVTFMTNSYCHWTYSEKLNPSEKYRIEEIDGIKVAWLKTFPYKGNSIGRGLNMITNFFRILQVSKIIKGKPDIIIGPSVPIASGWAAYLLSKKYKCKFIFEIRDIWPLALVNSGGIKKYGLIYLVFRILEKFLYKKSNKIFSTLPYVEEHVKQSGADTSKIVWIPNSINFKNKFDTYYGGNAEELICYYLGGFGLEHDPINIIRAAKILKEDNFSKIKFVLIGDGPKKQSCEDLAKKYLLNNIEFKDVIPKEQVQETLSKSDLLLVCIIDSPVYKYGINLNKIYDYLLSGRPIIFSGNSPNDPIRESGSGMSITPENPLLLKESLVHFFTMKPDKRAVLGKKGTSYAKNNFDIHLLVDKIEFNL